MFVKNHPIFFAKQSYQTKGIQFSPQQLVNMYAETAPEGTKGENNILLYGRAGLKTWLDTTNSSAINGAIVMGGDLYVVVNNTVIKIDTSKTMTTIGTLTGNAGRVMMSTNGTQITITDELGNGYIVTSTTLTQITDADYPDAVDNCYIDGYTVYPEKDSRTFYISDILDSSSVGALAFDVAYWEPKSVLLRAVNFNGFLWLIGSSNIEIYQNTGNPDFPFERVKGASISKGCASKFTVQQKEKVLIWLGDDKYVYMAVGFTYDKISTYPVDNAIRSYTTTSDAYGMIHQENGHMFYTLTFPTEHKSWCYDVKEKLWHERSSLFNSQSIQWRLNSAIEFNGKVLGMDFANGIIWELDSDTYKEGDNNIIAIIVSKVLTSNKTFFKLDKLLLDMEVGVGVVSGQGSNPQIMLSLSRDGGKTYGPELWRTFGALGSYLTRPTWRHLGYSSDLVFKLSISDPVERAIFGAYIDYELLNK